MLSSILSIFGLGQNHTHAVSAKYSEAIKLNAEFELNLNEAIELLRSEHMHLSLTQCRPVALIYAAFASSNADPNVRRI